MLEQNSPCFENRPGMLVDADVIRRHDDFGLHVVQMGARIGYDAIAFAGEPPEELVVRHDSHHIVVLRPGRFLGREHHGQHGRIGRERIDARVDVQQFRVAEEAGVVADDPVLVRTSMSGNAISFPAQPAGVTVGELASPVRCARS